MLRISVPPFLIAVVLAVIIGLWRRHTQLHTGRSDQPSSLTKEKGRWDALGVEILEIDNGVFNQTALFKKGTRDNLPLVMMLHGFPDNAATFESQITALSAAGYSVIAPILRGYEPRSAQLPIKSYTLGQIAPDFIRVIDRVAGPQAQVHLIGHDWGGSLAYVLGASYPERFLAIAAIGVPHDMVRAAHDYPLQIIRFWYLVFFQVPILPEIFLRGGGTYIGVRLLWWLWSPFWAPSAHALQSVIQTLKQPGVLRAALAYYRNTHSTLLPTLLKGGPALSSGPTSRPISVPVLGITGARDGCMDTNTFDITMKGKNFPAGVKVERIKGAGHFVHQEKHKEVNRILLDWLGRWSSER